MKKHQGEGQDGFFFPPDPSTWDGGRMKQKNIGDEYGCFQK